MNSDLYKNLDFFYSQLLDWLLGKSVFPALPIPQEESRQQMVNASQYTDMIIESEVNFLAKERWEMEDSNLDDEVQLFQSFDMGDIPEVQNRFQALLKRRLKQEIELNPPLFPWESTISDYEPEYSDDRSVHLFAPRQAWMPQLANLKFMVALPEQVLNHLLEACSAAMQLPRPQPAKVVEAVSSLFPDQYRIINDLAVALPGTYRDGSNYNLAAQIPQNYSEATTRQQMVLSLLAAREIIHSLTLYLSPAQNLIERQWQTDVGLVTLQAEYRLLSKSDSGENQGSVRLKVRLPKGGSLCWKTPQATAQAQRTYPGYLSVELFDCQIGQNYPVEISLAQLEEEPLTFAIVIDQ